MKNQETRIKRLEIAVIALAVAFIVSICVSIFAYMQIATLSSKLPSYHELKEDVKILKGAYDVTKEKVPVVKKAVVDSYEYTKDKASDLMIYIKGGDNAKQEEDGK